MKDYHQALKEYKEIYIDKTFKGDHCPSKEWYLQVIEEACEKADKYDELLKKMGNELLNDDLVLTTNSQLKENKQDTAKEIIEMLTIKGEYFFWKDGIYAYSKDIIQKIKERYGIKE